MGLFSKREKTAIIIICVITLIGWGIRLYLSMKNSSKKVDVIKNAAPVPDEVVKQADQSSAPLDINAASAAQLEALPGIGPSKAKTIVKYRKANGPFESVDAFADVPGVSPRMLEDLRESIIAGSDSTH